MHMLRYACAFAAEDENIAGRKFEIDVASARLRREQDHAAVGGVRKSIPRNVPYDCCEFQIIHTGAPEPRIMEQKSAGLDDVDRHAPARAEPDQRARVL